MDDDGSALPKEGERYGFHANDIIDRTIANIADGNTFMITREVRENYAERVAASGRTVEDLFVEDLKKFKLRIAN